MKTIIFYFSTTGNSLFVAKCLAEKLTDCELLSIPELLIKKEILFEADRVGFVFPLYFADLPILVEKYTKMLKLKKTHYIFSIITRGLTIGSAFSSLEKILNEKKLSLSYTEYITFPDNYIKMKELPTMEKLVSIFEKSEDTIQKIVNEIKETKIQRKGVNRLFHTILYPVHWIWKQKAASMDRKFYVSDWCNYCGTCVKACPVENLRYEQNRLVWLHHCEDCLGCVHICPVHAIQFSKKSDRLKRYRHPGINAVELIKKDIT